MFPRAAVCLTLPLTALLAAPLCAASSEQQLQEALERIDQLEAGMAELNARTGNRALAKAFDGLSLDIGGFLHTAYTAIDGENGNADSFNRQNFELLISADLATGWRAFFAGGFLRESDDPFAAENGGSADSPQFDTNNRTPQIIAWVDYQHNEALNLRLGRMVTPHGIINIEHFPATLLDAEQPQFLRPFSGDTLFPNFGTGAQLYGQFYLGEEVHTEYSLYVTNHSEAPQQEQFGGRVAVGLLDRALEIGLNYADGQRADGTIGNPNYELHGVDLLIDKGRFQLKSEYYDVRENVTGGTDDRHAFYVQPAFRLTDQWTAFYRHDVLKVNGVETEENLVGVNFLPASVVRLRATYTRKDFVDQDIEADIYQLSGTFSF